MRNRIWMLGATAALAAAAACGDSGGPGGASNVALLASTHFADYDTADYYAGASNMEYSLASLGVAVTPFTAVDSASLDGVLATSQALVIPADIGAPLVTDSLSAGALALIRDFVDSSGGILLVVADNQGLFLLDSLWGYTIGGGGGQNHYPLNGADAAGTPFAGGPSELWDNDGMYITDATTYPAGALIMYAASTDVALAVIPQGRGAIVVLAWDWYFAAPHGAQDGNWIEALRRALKL